MIVTPEMITAARKHVVEYYGTKAYDADKAQDPTAAGYYQKLAEVKQMSDSTFATWFTQEQLVGRFVDIAIWEQNGHAQARPRASVVRVVVTALFESRQTGEVFLRSTITHLHHSPTPTELPDVLRHAVTEMKAVYRQQFGVEIIQKHTMSCASPGGFPVNWMVIPD